MGIALKGFDWDATIHFGGAPDGELHKSLHFRNLHLHWSVIYIEGNYIRMTKYLAWGWSRYVGQSHNWIMILRRLLQVRTGNQRSCTFPCLFHNNLSFKIIMEQTRKVILYFFIAGNWVLRDPNLRSVIPAGHSVVGVILDFNWRDTGSNRPRHHNSINDIFYAKRRSNVTAKSVVHKGVFN